MQLSILIHAANIGFMVMFSAVVAPTVFKVLSQKAAGAYLRKLFPRMFMFGFITSSCAALAALLDSHSLTAIISVLVAVGFLGNAFILTPRSTNTATPFLLVMPLQKQCLAGCIYYLLPCFLVNCLQVVTSSLRPIYQASNQSSLIIQL